MMGLLFHVMAYAFVGFTALLTIFAIHFSYDIPPKVHSATKHQCSSRRFPRFMTLKVALHQHRLLMVVWGKRLLGVIGVVVILAVLKTANPSILIGVLWYGVPGGIFFGYLWQRSLGIRPGSVWIPVALLTIILSAITTTFVRLWLPHPLGKTTADAMGIMLLSSLPSVFAVGLLEWTHPAVLPEEVQLSRHAAWAFGSLFAVFAAILPIAWLAEHAGWLAVGVALAMITETVRRMRKVSSPRLRHLLIFYGAQWLLWNLIPMVWQISK